VGWFVNRLDGKVENVLTTVSTYRNVVMHHAKAIGISTRSFGTHSLQATAATNGIYTHFEHENLKAAVHAIASLPEL